MNANDVKYTQYDIDGNRQCCFCRIQENDVGMFYSHEHDGRKPGFYEVGGKLYCEYCLTEALEICDICGKLWDRNENPERRELLDAPSTMWNNEGLQLIAKGEDRFVCMDCFREHEEKWIDMTKPRWKWPT